MRDHVELFEYSFMSYILQKMMVASCLLLLFWLLFNFVMTLTATIHMHCKPLFGLELSKIIIPQFAKAVLKSSYCFDTVLSYYALLLP